MKLFKPAFTLAEVLITLGIIGVLAAIVTPVLIAKKPSKTKALIRKNYFVIERVIEDMKNDEATFPHEGVSRKYFAYYDETKENSTNQKTGQRFCEEFGKMLNVSTINCPAGITTNSMKDAYNNNKALDTNKQSTFITSDGAEWYIPNVKFCDPEKEDTSSCDTISSLTTKMERGMIDCPEAGDTKPYTCIYVDVDGFNTGKNKNPINNNEIDRFYVYVLYDGRIRIPAIVTGTKLPEILKSKSLF